MSEQSTSINTISFLEQVSVKKAVSFIIGLSIIAVLFLFWIIYLKGGSEADYPWVAYLPYVNASFNGISTLCLLLGFSAIRKRDFGLHMKYMLGAFGSSSLFLVSYIIYHNFHGETKFLAEGFISYIYFFTLISHILLSIFVVPLVLTSFYFALSGKLDRHRKIAKITFPIWLYVSITGVLIVVMLKVFN